MNSLRNGLLAAFTLLLATPAIPATTPAAAPANSGVNLIVSINKKLLLVREGDTTVKTYTVATGSAAHPTPTGRFTLKHIVWNPAWHPPAAKWAKGKEAKAPGDPKNPMKVVKLFFQEPDYYIHGSDRDIESERSHGCVRMEQEDVAQLAKYLMEQDGATKPDGWYDAVLSGKQSESVMLPRGVPVIVAK